MQFEDYLLDAAKKIDQALGDFFLSWEEELRKISLKLLPFAQVLSKNCGGGKKLRGMLVILGYQLLRPKPNQKIIKPAVALELFQTAILAHDDIIDQSPLRRGQPTIYKQLGGDHYAISQAISLADVGFFLASKLISDSDFDPQIKNHALSYFNRMAVNTGLGEILDVALPYLKNNKSENDVITIHKLKTSYYTIIDPLSIGAILAGADQVLLKKIETFGENLGIAFQIQDDILGVFGDEKILGKSVTSDIEEGKNTTLITHALKKASPEQKKVLQKNYGQGKISQDKHHKIKKIFIETGALDYSQRKAVQYVEKAKKIIPNLSKDEQNRSLLQGLADFLVERQK